MVYNLRFEMSDGDVVVGLSVNFEKAFDPINHGCVELKLILRI